MSEIDPEFSFPTFSGTPQSAPSLAPAPIHSQLPLGSPVSKGRRHAHRRSAAMSEDLSAVELAAIITPQLSGSASFKSPPSPTHRTWSNSMPPPAHSESRPKYPDPQAFQFQSHLNSPSPRRLIGEPGQLVPGGLTKSKPTVASVAPPIEASPQSPRRSNSKKKKRRSFVQLFRKSNDVVDPEPTDVFNSSSASSSSLTISSVHSAERLTPPPSAPTPIHKPQSSFHAEDANYADATITDGDDTLVPPLPLQTPVMQQTPQFSSSPLATPRSSTELPRGLEVPTIDLDEALSCSFSSHHHKSESVLESPFSKAPSAMNAVLEEEDEEDLDADASESDSINSASKQYLQAKTYLHKTSSICSNSSSLNSRRHSPHPPPRPSSILTNGGKGISYIGAISPKPTATPPPLENSSPRVSIITPEQVSNLAILDLKSTTPPASNPRKNSTNTVKHLSTPPQTKSAKRGHTRRRSILDKLLRRD